jgi:carboxyl-terminal processing protease
MNKNVKNNRFLSTLLIVSTVLFTNVIFFTPKLFAQTAPDAKVSATLQARQYMELITSVFNFVQNNYVDEVDPSVLYQGALKGMMDSLKDPYTSYLDLSQMRTLTDTTVGNFGGVGLSITKPVESTPEKPAYVEVASPIEDGPGYKAGIQAGDFLLEIDGTPTPEITMDEVLSKLRGTIGQTVTVLVKRGRNMQFSVTLTRELIEVPTVKYSMIEQGSNKIGYLRIIEFTPQTAERVQAALDSFNKNKYTGMIIDLRNNPGGLITSVADVADKFIDEGVIVTTKSRLASENVVFNASKSKTTVPQGTPIVVLINRGSASASEILSGALKDDHLAYLVGERTYGKGSVQQVIPLYNDDGIKLTMARYYTPSDVNIDKIGIPPDLEVLFPVLSDDEEGAYVDLINSMAIENYVLDNPNMSEKQITEYAKELQKTYKLTETLLRRLIRVEVQRTKGASNYDLDYDVQLNAAIDVLQKGNFAQLLMGTKTLRELQDEVILSEADTE